MLTVKRTVLQLGGKLHEEPMAKSRAGDRLVFLDAETTDLLRAHHRAQLRARMKAGAAWQDNDLIFCQADGRPWDPDHVSKRFKKLAAQAGVPVIKLHEGGRHTGNSLMRDAGVDQEVRMREVGHAGKDINDRYTHVLIEAHLAAAELRASCALAARLPRSRAADGPERTGCTDGSVHEPVHGRGARSLNPATVRNIVSSAPAYVRSLRPSPRHS